MIHINQSTRKIFDNEIGIDEKPDNDPNTDCDIEYYTDIETMCVRHGPVGQWLTGHATNLSALFQNNSN